MTQHTPGPWEAFQPSGKGSWWIRTTGEHPRNYMGIAETKRTVGVLGTKTVNGPPEEEAANAELIAAAPDLLAALEAFIDDDEQRIHRLENVEVAREVIDRAKGKK